jgi:hypothetical protein
MKTIEAQLGSPPEKERLAVQLFAVDSGPQWAEIDFEEGRCVLEIFCRGSAEPQRFPLDEVLQVFQSAKQRLEDSYPEAQTKKEPNQPPEPTQPSGPSGCHL